MSRREEENPSPLEDPHGHPFQRASLYPDMNGHLPRVSAPDVGMVGPSDVPTRPLQAWRFPDTPSGVVGASGVAQTIWTPTNEGTSFDASIGNSHHAVAQTNPYLDAAAMPPSEMFNHDNHGGVLNVGSMPAIGLSSHDNRGFHLGGQQVHNPRDSPYEKAGQFAFFGSNPELQEGVGLRDSYPISFQSNVRYNHRPKHPESQPVGSDAIDAHAIFDHGGDPTQPALTLGEDIAVPRTFDSSYLPQHAPWTPYRDVHAGWPSYNPSWGNGGSPQESMNKALSPPVPKPEGISSVDSSLENSASEGQKEIKLCQKPIPQEDPPSGSNRERPGQFPAKRSRGKRTGPLNPEQKKHARDMRKQGACDVCSSRKIRVRRLSNGLIAIETWRPSNISASTSAPTSWETTFRRTTLKIPTPRSVGEHLSVGRFHTTQIRPRTTRQKISRQSPPQNQTQPRWRHLRATPVVYSESLRSDKTQSSR